MSTLLQYQRHYANMFTPLLDLSLHGVAVDEQEMAAVRSELLSKCADVQDELNDLIGAWTCRECNHHNDYHLPERINIYADVLRKDGKPRVPKFKMITPCEQCECPSFTPVHLPLHTDKDLSSQRVIKFLYATLGFPPQRKRGEKTLTADEITCRKLMLRTQAWVETQAKARKPKPSKKRWQLEPDFAIKSLTLILDHREAMKLCGYADPSHIDEDSRLRSQYKVTTEPGRLSSSGNPFKTGLNLQNIPRGRMRRCFIPDAGCVMWARDFSQAEYRLVKVLSKDPGAIHEARLRPAAFDAYTAKAKYVFAHLLNCAEDSIDVKAEVVPGTTRRQLIKPVVLGIGYGEGPQKLQDTLLKDGVVLSLDMCQQLLALAREPYVLAYQKDTRKQIMMTGILTNSWGRQLDLRGERLDDRTYRRGYAFRGASENADNLNQLGFVPLHGFIARHHLQTAINLQVHDELVGSSPVDELYDVLAFLGESMEQEREYDGVKLIIPATAKIGSTWAGDFEWKELPDRYTVEHAARECLAKCRERERRAA